MPLKGSYFLVDYIRKLHLAAMLHSALTIFSVLRHITVKIQTSVAHCYYVIKHKISYHLGLSVCFLIVQFWGYAKGTNLLPKVFMLLCSYNVHLSCVVNEVESDNASVWSCSSVQRLVGEFCNLL